MNKQEFQRRFKVIIDETWELFREKNEQYGTWNPFANFSRGAQLSYGDESYNSMYETLLSYMNKHVAHVYNQTIDGHKVRESLGDIVVYSIIAMIMIDQNEENKKALRDDSLLKEASLCNSCGKYDGIEDSYSPDESEVAENDEAEGEGKPEEEKLVPTNTLTIMRGTDGKVLLAFDADKLQKCDKEDFISVCEDFWSAVRPAKGEGDEDE